MHYRSIYKQQRPEHKLRHEAYKRHRGTHKQHHGTHKRHHGTHKRHHGTYKCLERKQIEILESGIKESFCFNRVFFDAKRNQLSSTYAHDRKKVIFYNEDITFKILSF
ncbi:MAG: hypothetical protein JW857_09765 [Bacteroidales bacterium]|nr:hypothetical protein [Bacteroidales bacterium]